MDSTVFVNVIRELFAVRREVARGSFPLRVRYPAQLLGGDIEQGHVIVAALSIGAEQDGFAVGREVGGRDLLLALVLRQVLGSAGGDVDEVSVRVIANRV